MLPNAIGKEEVENSHSEIPPCLFQVGNPAPSLLSNALMRGHSSTCSRILYPFPTLFTSQCTDRCTDTSTPAHVHPNSPYPCAYTHFQSCHLFHTAHASPKCLCTDPAPLMLSKAKWTPNATSLPVSWGVFMAGWPVGELAPDHKKEKGKRRRGRNDGALNCLCISIPQFDLQLLILRGSRRFPTGPVKHLPASERVPDTLRQLR